MSILTIDLWETPIYDTMMTEQNAAPAKPRYTVQPPENVAVLLVAQDVRYEPEPKWKTFLRCLLWWMP